MYLTLPRNGKMTAHSNKQFDKTLYYMTEFSKNTFLSTSDLEYYLIYECNAVIYSHQIDGRIIFEKFDSDSELIIDYYDAYIKCDNEVIKDILSTDGYFNATLRYPNLPSRELLKQLSESCLLVHNVHIPWNI